MKKQFTILFILALIMLNACATKKDVIFTSEQRGSAKTMYEQATRFITKNPERARLMFKEIMQLYPDDNYSRRAKIGIADSYFNQKDASSLIVAASEYQEYVNLYPNSPDAAYAKFQVGNCYYKQMRKPERDQSQTFEAIKAFESLVKMYPDTKEAEQARKNVIKARQNLATHYYKIGYYNYKYGALRGAVTRFKQVIDEYPDFKQNDQMFFITGKVYLLLREFDSSVSFFQKVINSYPKSKYAKKAVKMLRKVEKERQKPAPKVKLPKNVKPKEGDKK